MNFTLIGMGAIVVLLAYCICIALVLGATFGTLRLFGRRIGPEGDLQTWGHIMHIGVWFIAAFIAGWIVQKPVNIGLSPILMALSLAAGFFVVQLRSLFVMERQQSRVVQIALCILCPIAVFAAYEFV
jgi:hypothetical protein